MRCGIFRGIFPLLVLVRSRVWSNMRLEAGVRCAVLSICTLAALAAAADDSVRGFLSSSATGIATPSRQDAECDNVA